MLRNTVITEENTKLIFHYIVAISNGFSRALVCVTNNTPSRGKGQTLTVKYDFKPLTSFSTFFYLTAIVSQICQLGWNRLKYGTAVTANHLLCQFVWETGSHSILNPELANGVSFSMGTRELESDPGNAVGVSLTSIFILSRVTER